jgi:hypothetical protein
VNGELAQAAALTAYGNVALASSDPSAFLTLEHSTFQFVFAIRFERAQRRLLRPPRIVALGTAPVDWYRHLANSGVRCIDLAVEPATGRLPNPVAASFSGGGSWGIRTAGTRATSLWRARWSPDRREDPSRRIWSVAYRELPGHDAPVPRESVREASDRLRTALTHAERLALDADLRTWARWFGDASEKLGAARAVFEHHADLLPPTGYTEPARTLLAACERAWVFGGMGSWNDVGFEDPELDARYRAVTPELFSAVLRGIAAAVNSFPTTGPSQRAD